MKLFFINFLAIGFVLLACGDGAKLSSDSEPKIEVPSKIDYHLWKIENGRFYHDNKHTYLKIAKPLHNFADAAAVQRLISSLGTLKTKNYNTISLNCYWHHFDYDGDGVIDVSLQALNRLINTIYDMGMYPVLSVETYSVGGGQIPEGFWTTFSDAEAINSDGKAMVDSEYGFGSRVVSIFHEGYQRVAREFIKNLTKGIDHKKILYFETTVEPQYMGIVHLCYSNSAKQAYAKWLEKNNITDSHAQMPTSFPIPQEFIRNATWNRFRAEFLADWVNGDAKAFKEIAGSKANIAVDYLDAEDSSMPNRNGDSDVFLDHLTEANIIQVNWTWFFPENKPNKKAYEHVRRAMNKNKRDWAITEHMTFNGSDFMNFTDQELRNILQNTIDSGTQFGWEFVSVINGTTDSFATYNDDWTPKRPIAMVDNNWKHWLDKIYSIK